jgi:RNA-binding protein
MLTPAMKRRIKHELSNEKPTIWIGKSTVSARILDEIDKQLERSEVVKIRVLKTALKEEKTKDVVLKAAKQTNSTLVEVRGHTFILYRRAKTKK